MAEAKARAMNLANTEGPAKPDRELEKVFNPPAKIDQTYALIHTYFLALLNNGGMPSTALGLIARAFEFFTAEKTPRCGAIEQIMTLVLQHSPPFPAWVTMPCWEIRGLCRHYEEQHAAKIHAEEQERKELEAERADGAAQVAAEREAREAEERKELEAEERLTGLQLTEPPPGELADTFSRQGTPPAGADPEARDPELEEAAAQEQQLEDQ